MARMTAAVKTRIVKLFKLGTRMDAIKAEVKPHFPKITAAAVLRVVRNHLMDDCDILWSRVIRQVGACEICGSTGRLEAHHLIRRQVYDYRWAVSNGVCLCTTHHEFGNDIAAHGSNDVTSKFAEWMQVNRPGQWAWMLEHRGNRTSNAGKITCEELLEHCELLTGLLKTSVKPELGARKKELMPCT